MPNETDKQELSEDLLNEWQREAATEGGPFSKVRRLIKALRATRQELAASEKELEIRKGSGKVAHERIAELEQQLVNSKWLRHELNAYYLGYPTSEEEVLEYKKVCAMSDADFLASIKAQDFKDKEQLVGYRGLIEAISPFVSCSICGSPAEYIETENCWRHRGLVDKYYAQTFCDKYGYPINLRFDHTYALIEGGYVQIEPSERIKFLEQQSQRDQERIAELEQQLSQAKIEIGGRDLVINSARIGEQHNRERIEELEALLGAHMDVCTEDQHRVAMIEARATLAKKEVK